MEIADPFARIYSLVAAERRADGDVRVLGETDLERAAEQCEPAQVNKRRLGC